MILREKVTRFDDVAVSGRPNCFSRAAILGFVGVLAFDLTEWLRFLRLYKSFVLMTVEKA